MDCRVKPGNDRGGEPSQYIGVRLPAAHVFNGLKRLPTVMPGLDPGIHTMVRPIPILRFAFVALAHGLPGQARQ